MKRLREIIPLSETPMMSDQYGMEHRLTDTEPYNQKGNQHNFLSVMKSGHHLYKHESKNDIIDTNFYAHNPHTNLPDIWVGGQLHDKHFYIDTISGRKGSTIKAHDFYHHLIKHHGLTLHSSTFQSRGGQKIWKQLAVKPDVEITKRSITDQKPIPVHPPSEWDKNYDDLNPFVAQLKTKSRTLTKKK